MTNDSEGEPRSTRSRAKGPTRSSEDDASQKKSKKLVYRLLKKSDIKKTLVGEEVYVLWPDNGTWYKATFEDIAVKALTASLFYEETEEEEEADLNELIAEGQIAFLEERPANHECSSNEIGVDEKYFGRQPDEAKTAKARQSAEEDGGEQEQALEEPEEEEDAGAKEPESDPSFSSAEVKRGKKKGRGGSGSEDESSEDQDSDDDDEVKLEEFEKRELLKDMSDDEKPLYTRMTEAERKQRRQAAAQKRAAAAAAAAAASGAGLPATPRGTVAKAEAKGAAEAIAQEQQALARPRSAEAAAGPAAAVTGAARPRRRASEGVAMATQALAMAAGVRLDPVSPREVSEEEAAERYAQQLLAKVATQKSVDRGSFYGGRQPSGGLEHRTSGPVQQSEEDVREKVRGRFKQALELAAKEAAWEDTPAAQAGVEGEGEGEGGKPDPAEKATAVEEALFQLCGGVTKEYKSKCQSLIYNLKDPSNPDLRARVMWGQLLPDRLVRMTATELASRELAEYRKRIEQEALEMSVLDAEAAARFSTAAALEAREKLAVPAELLSDKLLSAREDMPGGGGGGGGGRGGERSPSPLPQAPGVQHWGGRAGAAGTPRAGAGAGETPRAGAAAAAGEGVGSVGAGGEATLLPTTIGAGGLGAELATVAHAGGEGPSTYNVSEVAGAPASGGSGGSGGGGSGRAEVGEGGAGEDAYDPEQGLEDEDLQGGAPMEGVVPPPPPPGSPPRAPPASGPGGIDWASIKARALEESASAAAAGPPGETLPKLDPLEPLPALATSASEGSEGRKRERGHSSPHHSHHHHHHHHGHSQGHGHHLHRSSSGGGGAGPSPREGVPPTSPPGAAASGGEGPPQSPGSLAHLVLPQPDPTVLGLSVWEGQFLIPGAGAFLLTADALAGAGDVAGMLGEQEIELKGRVPVSKLDTFLVELRRSRSRTVTLGLLRPAADAMPDERAAFKDVVQQYSERQRTGFGEARTYPGAGGAQERVEVYVLPGGDLVRRILRAARGTAPATVEAALPGGQADIGPEQLLLVLIHKRDWREWFNPGTISRPVKRQRMHPPPQLPTSPPPAAPPSLPLAPVSSGPMMATDPRIAGAAGAGAPPPPPGAGIAAPAAGAAPALPNIDWAALSAITASLNALPGGAAGGQPGLPQSGPPGAAPAVPELPALGQIGWVTSQPQQAQQAQQGMVAFPPGPPPPGSAPPTALPFDPAMLQQLQPLLQQTAAPAAGAGAAPAEGAASKKRKSRWELEGSGQEGVAGEAGGAGIHPPAGFGPMRREAAGVGPQLEQPPQQLPFASQPQPVPPGQFPGQQPQQPMAASGPPQGPPMFMGPPGGVLPQQPLPPHPYQHLPPQGQAMGPPGHAPQFGFMPHQVQQQQIEQGGYGGPGGPGGPPMHMGFPSVAGGPPGLPHQPPPPPHDPQYYQPHQVDQRGGGRGGYPGGRGPGGRGPPSGGRRGGGRQ